MRDADCGAKRGTVASVRDPGARVTAKEKKLMAVMRVEMTKAEAEQMRKDLRPRAHHIPSGQLLPGATEEEIEIWMSLMRVERKKLRIYGVETDMANAAIADKIAELDDKDKNVEPFTVSKTAFTVKKQKAVEI